tara:strand:+ start:602 stop:1975 length:1374 start_codon:yes stop_codon:yes gene_type:complete
MGLLNQTKQAYYNSGNHGDYQFSSLNDIISQFMVVYVGEDKIIPKAKRTDVAFHAQRAMQELSFDTFKSCKSQEITVPASLKMILPQDYVNYTKVSWIDSAGIKHLMYPTDKTSNPMSPQIDSDGDFLFDLAGNQIPSGNLLAGEGFEGGTNDFSLNVTARDGIPQGGIVINSNITPGVPDNNYTTSTGWLWHNNKLKLFNAINNNAIRQTNIPIYSGETYTLTFTISDYVAGNYTWYLVDEDGKRFTGTTVTADGTYTQTIDMSTATFPATTWQPQSIAFRNDATGGGADSVSLDSVSLVRVGDEASVTLSNYNSSTPSENSNDNYDDDTYWRLGGNRYGLNPQHSQTNGSFYIDCDLGEIHFSSNVNGNTVVLDYLSDSLGTDSEMRVHKFAEEAMYKSIIYAVLSTKANTQEYIVRRYKKERFAAIRTAKLRLSNIKLEEITQILRGKSKQIKH